jgi:ubiquinone/menaquinone biosynthesis C-methylase UbiE
MAERVCPWWIGYLLACPVRRWVGENPEDLLAPYVREGMTVLEPGPGMGFFTLPLARMVGPAGRVVAVDIQAKMLDSLQRRARKAGVHSRVETRLAKPESMGLDDLMGAVDFVLAFAVVHEMPSAQAFFNEAAAALKPGGLLFFAEPAGHVKQEHFQKELDAARQAGLETVSQPAVRRSHAAVLRNA